MRSAKDYLRYATHYLCDVKVHLRIVEIYLCSVKIYLRGVMDGLRGAGGGCAWVEDVDLCVEGDACGRLLRFNLTEVPRLPFDIERNPLMKDTDIRAFEMFARVDDLGETLASSFSATSLGGQKFAAVGVVVEELKAHGTTQSSGKGAAQASTSAKRVARKDVREKMVAIRETARALEEVMPGISSNFRVPHGNGDQALINSARAFVAAATPIKNEFLQREMPATFLEDLTTAVAGFESAVNEKNTSTEKRITATAAISASLERGLKLVRELDPIVRNKFRSDPATLAAWESASHVERPPKKKKPVPATPPST